MVLRSIINVNHLYKISHTDLYDYTQYLESLLIQSHSAGDSSGSSRTSGLASSGAAEFNVFKGSCARRFRYFL